MFVPEYSVIVPVFESRTSKREKDPTTENLRGSKWSLPALLTFCAFLASPLLGADPPLIPLTEIRAGMKGYGLSVFSGTAPERFDVEVVGVLANNTPGRSMIVVRIAGKGLEEAGVVAGMSGSPVYLEGRLAGAVASGWGFAKVPLAGVTPIEDMLRIELEAGGAEKAPAGSALGRRVPASHLIQVLSQAASGTEGAFFALKSEFEARLPPLPVLRTGAAGQIAAGFPAATLETFKTALTALSLPNVVPGPLSTAPASSSSTAPGPLKEGSSIAALLVGGDLQLGATGTVTYVYPDGRFLAFGHPFLGMGELELPVAPAPVVTILPNLFQSFKLASPGEPAYRLRRDRDSGISGSSDSAGPSVPATLEFESGGTKRTLRLSLASHPKLLPSLIALSTDASINNFDPTPRERTLSYSITLTTPAGDVRFSDVTSGMRARETVALTAGLLTAVVSDSDFAERTVSRIHIRLESSAGEKRFRILDAAASARKVRPGDEVALSVRLLERRGSEFSRTLKIRIPKETPEGRLSVFLADGSTASGLRLSLNPAEPRGLQDLKRLLDSLSSSNKISAVAVVPSRGAATGAAAFTALPPSAAYLLAVSRNLGDSGSGEVEGRIVAEAAESLSYPVTGNIRLDFEVERPLN